MQKLKLDLDTLEVASFETSDGNEQIRGTVMGRNESVISVSLMPLTPPIVSYFICD